MTPMRIVSPYRPFEPESPSHRKLGAFDWIEALRMLAASVRQACSCDTIAVTDVDTTLPVPSFQYATTHRRLMLWIVEVSLAYLESSDFDRDTVFVSPDTIVTADLRPYFAGDLSILVRSARKYTRKPILNAVQWWPVASKDNLIAFYRETLSIATQLPGDLITWGADSECLRRQIDPVMIGLHQRSGLTVHMVEASRVLLSISSGAMHALDQRKRVTAGSPIVDFKGPRRKPYMRRYFEALGLAVAA